MTEAKRNTPSDSRSSSMSSSQLLLHPLLPLTLLPRPLSRRSIRRAIPALRKMAKDIKDRRRSQRWSCDAPEESLNPTMILTEGMMMVGSEAKTPPDPQYFNWQGNARVILSGTTLSPYILRTEPKAKVSSNPPVNSPTSTNDASGPSLLAMLFSQTFKILKMLNITPALIDKIPLHDQIRGRWKRFSLPTARDRERSKRSRSLAGRHYDRGHRECGTGTVFLEDQMHQKGSRSNVVPPGTS
ncbi:hypothetical protein BKA70DRAFT_1527168 [Coprinopsis sp. MPI-PUGE-AT-0042]|nr:hypothetical protein BKA70DRAFT_1527168 [Coprinopsis sp. MPI-PUGE-AT-0042]